MKYRKKRNCECVCTSIVSSKRSGSGGRRRRTAGCTHINHALHSLPFVCFEGIEGEKGRVQGKEEINKKPSEREKRSNEEKTEMRSRREIGRRKPKKAYIVC